MEAGASHSMALRRHLSRTLLVLASLACWAVVPASADAALLDTVDSTVAPVAPPVQTTAQDVVDAVQPAVSAGTTPAPEADGGAVQQAVAPIADATGATVPSVAASAPATRLNEPARASVHRISARASSAERVNSGRAAHRSRRAAEPHSAAELSATRRDAVRQPSGVASAAHPAAPASPAAPEPSSGLTAGAPASGASAALSFGGGLALLVAALLLAGPRLRRRLRMLPAVCRPAAFLVVLERPG
jgi:hypothetical protein